LAAISLSVSVEVTPAVVVLHAATKSKDAIAGAFNKPSFKVIPLVPCAAAKLPVKAATLRRTKLRILPSSEL
jgi:hypothetical protein